MAKKKSSGLSARVAVLEKSIMGMFSSDAPKPKKKKAKKARRKATKK